MSDVGFSLPGPDTVTLSGQQVNKLLSSGDGDATLLFLYLLKTEGKSTPDETMMALGRGKGWYNSAMATLSRIGLILIDKEVPKTEMDEIPDEPDDTRLPSFSDIKAELEAGSNFSIVVEETERTLGRVLSSDDMMRLFGIYENLRMPPEVILQLITYCIREGRRTGGDRAINLRYIEKAAYTWAHAGIITLEKAEEYIKNLEDRRSLQGEFKHALKIYDREFSATEKKFVDNWITMGFEADAIEIAYDRTIIKTGKMAWSYMDSIITNWHKKGIHTADDVKKKDSKEYRQAQFLAASNKSSRSDAPNQAEIDRMKAFLEETRRGEGG